MAVLHRKEEKIQAVLGRLPKKHTQEQFVEMFIKLYSKDWGKIKSAYIKQSQDKLPGAIINMPKPEIYLKQVLTNYLQNVDEVKPEVKVEPAPAEVVAVKKPKVIAKATDDKLEEAKPKKATAKKGVKTEDAPAEPKKAKTVAKKAVEKTEVATEEPIKIKAVGRKKVEKTEVAVEKPVKVKAVAKKKEETAEEKPKPVRKTTVKK